MDNQTTDLSSTIIGDENELTESQRIDIFKEVLRVIEKDIDVLRTTNSREGWSTWGIIGGIAACAVYVINSFKDLNSTPAGLYEVIGTFLSLVPAFLIIHASSYGVEVVKEKRLLHVEEKFKGQLSSFVARFLIVIGALVAVFAGQLPSLLKSVVVMLLLLPNLYPLVVLVFGYQRSLPLGNNPKYKNLNRLSLAVTVVCYAISALVIGVFLESPFGKGNSVAYGLGLAIGTIILLIQFLLWNPQIPTMNELDKLRDDLLFNRITLTQAILSFQLLKEGRTLLEHMKPDLSQIEDNFIRQNVQLKNQAQLLDKLAPKKIERSNRKSTSEKNEKAMEMIIHDLNLAFVEQDRLAKEFADLWPNVDRNLQQATQASGDYESETQIRDRITKAIDELNFQTAQNRNRINEMIAPSEKLSPQS